jgi:uncharacterized protein DUF899
MRPNPRVRRRLHGEPHASQLSLGAIAVIGHRRARSDARFHVVCRAEQFECPHAADDAVHQCGRGAGCRAAHRARCGRALAHRAAHRLKKERGWRSLKLYSDANGDFSRDYHAITKEGGDDAGSMSSRAATTRSGISGAARWDSRAPIRPGPARCARSHALRTILDLTPEGRGKD